MAVIITDEQLREMNMTVLEARIEIACRLFDARKLELWPAAQLAGLSRIEMEDELVKRRIAIYRPTIDDVESDLATIRRLERKLVSR